MTASGLSLLLALLAAAPPTPPSQREPPAEQTDWDRGFAALEVRYPRTKVNAAARNLEKLAAELGIDLAPLAPDRTHPGRLAATKFLGLRAGAYVRAQVEDTDDSFDPPPPALDAFLKNHADTIRRIVSALSTGETPRWDLDVRRGSSGERLNWLGELGLQRVLVAVALARTHEGRTADALAALEASWKLNQAIVRCPEMLGQMIVINASRTEAGALRKLPNAPPVWLERLRFAEIRSSVIASIQSDVWMSHVGRRQHALESSEMLVFADGMNRLGVALGEQDACSFSPEVAEKIWRPLFAGSDSSVLAELRMPGVLELVERSFHVRLDGEMTAEVLKARAFRASSGAWPGQVSTGSAVCPEASWVTEAERDGTATVWLRGPEPRWSGRGGLQIPPRFTIGTSRR